MGHEVERCGSARSGRRASKAVYRAWLQRGDPVVGATISGTLADAVDRGIGRLEIAELPHRYGYLLSLGTRRP